MVRPDVVVLQINNHCLTLSNRTVKDNKGDTIVDVFFHNSIREVQ